MRNAWLFPSCLLVWAGVQASTPNTPGVTPHRHHVATQAMGTRGRHDIANHDIQTHSFTAHAIKRHEITTHDTEMHEITTQDTERHDLTTQDTETHDITTHDIRTHRATTQTSGHDTTYAMIRHYSHTPYNYSRTNHTRAKPDLTNYHITTHGQHLKQTRHMLRRHDPRRHDMPTLSRLSRTSLDAMAGVGALVRMVQRIMALLDPVTGVFRLIRGRRDVRKDAREDISSHSVLQCLPLVLCAINTDPQDLVAPREPAAAGWFSNSLRSWRALTPRWVTDAVTPTPPHTSCLEAFPACPWATPTQNNISD